MFIPLLFCFKILLLVTKIGAAQVPAIIVFGDSSVDAGNNNFIPTIARSNFEPYGRDFAGSRPTGRFSNGRITPDFISEAYGLRPTVPAYLDPAYDISDFAVGVSFASAGTGYDNATSDVLGVIPLWKEVEYYKEYQTRLKAYVGHIQARRILSEAIYLISIGTNDFLENYYASPAGRQSQFTIQQYQHFLLGLSENFIRQLYGLGARRLSLTGTPPMGCLPLERATNFMGNHECVENYNNLALEFNGKLMELVGRLNRQLPGFKIVFADAYQVLMPLIKQPSRYGFEVAESGCCGTGRFEMSYLCDKNCPLTCPDANKYIFWDAFHCSERTNKIISDYVVKYVFPKLLS